jgi:hypothetical protein
MRTIKDIHYQIQGDQNMDKVTHYDFVGNVFLLFLLSILGFTIPFAVVYFTTNLVKIETAVPDGEQLSDFIKSKK